MYNEKERTLLEEAKETALTSCDCGKGKDCCCECHSKPKYIVEFKHGFKDGHHILCEKCFRKNKEKGIISFELELRELM